MTLGYYLNGQDNDSTLNPDLYEMNISECLDFVNNRQNYINKDFKIKLTKYEFSYTYDGALIVSKRFKDFCETNKLKGIEFYQLENQKDFYLFKVENIIEFDCDRRKTSFLEYNEFCGEFNEVVGASPVCLKNNRKIKTGIYRTDVEFGRGYAKGPLILIDPDTFIKVKKEKFIGLYGEKILDKYDWEKENTIANTGV